MKFGSLLGIAHLDGAFLLDGIRAPAWARGKWPWIESHSHFEGPCCLVLSNIRRFKQELAFKGHQGWWDVDDAIVAGREFDVLD